jgi:hypothetical protein
MIWTIVLWGLSVIVAFILGMAVYRNNAKKFTDLEAKAKAKGKSIDSLLGV